MANHNVQSVGASDLSLVLSHPVLENAGYPASLSLTGFKLEGQFLGTDQIMDNAKVVPLLNGDSITITNTNRAGVIRFTCTRAAGSIVKGDIVAIANTLQELGDNVGGTLVVSFGFNGATFKVTFFAVCVKRAPPLVMAGNDVPDYAVELTYADFKIG